MIHMLHRWPTRVLVAGAVCAAVAVVAAATPRPAMTPADPALFPAGTRVLFQGDSITDGNRGRNADPNHILGHGYAFIIAARQGADHPDLRLEFINRGVSGNRVADLAARWQADALELKPDVLSILIGVNDMGRTNVEEFERKYDELLEQTRAALPKVKLVLCEPFALAAGKIEPKWEEYRAELAKRQAVVARLATKHGARLVRLQRVFEDAARRAPADYWIWDGIHPTYRGHQLIADEWVRTVREPRPSEK